MKGFLRLSIVIFLAMSLTHCVSEDTKSDANGSAQFTDQMDDDLSSASVANKNSSDDLDAEVSQAEKTEKSVNSANDLDADIPATTDAPPAAAKKDEFSDFEESAPAAAPPAVVDEAPPVVAASPPPAVVAEPPPAADPQPMVETQSPPPAVVQEPKSQIATIKNIRFKGAKDGGTIVVDGDTPLEFTTRMNNETNQFIVEIPNVKLSKRLQRPYITKDIASTIGSIDAYQNAGSDTARIVVQLKKGATEPTIQADGKTLVISALAKAGGEEDTAQMNSPILSSSSLEDFLAGENKYYGKKISIETNDLDIREAFKLISDESGVNMVLADDVKGTISLKLKQVPWDQAMIMILKAKKLGYTRSGNVLRIATLTEIRGEEDDIVKIEAAKKSNAPLVVKMIPISYAKVSEIESQVKPFLTEKGKIASDARTNSVVLSDTQESLDRATKLIKSIDIPPPQVLIEGKIVEATETFQRTLGINWAASGQPQNINGATSTTGLAVSTLGQTSTGSLGVNFSLGTLDILGDLSAQLSLFEKQSTAKVLSSPRVVTLHNEPAEITQNTQVPIVTITNQQGVTTKTATFKDVKLKLAVTPQITNDGSVIMAIDVNRDFLGTIDVSTQTASIESRSAKTKVLVKNGQTAVIGGIYINDTTLDETKVPFLGDIPVIGYLFKSQNRNKNRNELLIFLTPRILAQLQDSSSASPLDNKEDVLEKVN